MKWAALVSVLTVLSCSALSRPVMAQATPLVVVSPTGCPSAGEIQAALGDEVAVIESSTAPSPEVRAVIGVAEVTTSDEGSYRVRVELPGQPPLERTLPRADCATAARLVAIVVRGVDFRASMSAPAVDAPVEETAPLVEAAPVEAAPVEPVEAVPVEVAGEAEPAIEEVPASVRWNLGIATGLGLEITPTDGAWTEQVDLGLAYEALVLRVALVAATPTHTAVQTESLERIGFGARVDVGASAALNETFSFGGRFGVGVLIASLASPTFAPSQFFRATPTIGMQLFGEAHLDGALFSFLELGLDVPLVRDTYALGASEIGYSPAVLLRALVGIRVAFP